MIILGGSIPAGIHQRGFTLIEVLIALVVAAIGLLSLFLMQGNAVKGNIVSSQCTRAAFLAQGMIERIKEGNIVEEGTFGFIDMSATDPGIVLETEAFIGIDEKGDTGGPFNLQWQVATHTEWSRRITVHVWWSSILGSTRNVNLASVSRGNGN